MPARVPITIIESEADLKTQVSRSSDYLRPRIRMLIFMLQGIENVNELAAKTGTSTTTILIYKNKYKAGGLAALLSDARGGDKRSGLSDEQKQQIEAKLRDPQNGLRSFSEAQAWMKEVLGIEKNYQTINKYLKRNFGMKLKVGRKSHVKKDDAAEAVFKKPGRNDSRY